MKFEIIKQTPDEEGGATWIVEVDQELMSFAVQSLLTDALKTYLSDQYWEEQAKQTPGVGGSD